MLIAVTNFRFECNTLTTLQKHGFIKVVIPATEKCLPVDFVVEIEKEAMARH